MLIIFNNKSGDKSELVTRFIIENYQNISTGDWSVHMGHFCSPLWQLCSEVPPPWCQEVRCYVGCVNIISYPRDSTRHHLIEPAHIIRWYFWSPRQLDIILDDIGALPAHCILQRCHVMISKYWQLDIVFFTGPLWGYGHKWGKHFQAIMPSCVQNFLLIYSSMPSYGGQSSVKTSTIHFILTDTGELPYNVVIFSPEWS